MDDQSIRKQLDACLIKDYLTAPNIFHKMQDPFPQWFQDAS